MSRVAAGLLLTLTVIVTQLPGRAQREVRLASPMELAKAVKEARPGDVLLLPDGTYADVTLQFSGKGTEQQPVTLRAATPGKAIFTGKSSLEVKGAWLVVDGLVFERCTVDPILFRNTVSCRLTRCVVRHCNPEDGKRIHWIRVAGPEARNNRVDHCYTEGKTKDGVVLVIDGDEGKMPLDTRIDHNHFKDVVRAVRNGMETVRVGTSQFGQVEARAVVEENLFEHASGDAEIISSKSCGNTYRYNTFVNCDGGVVMRHGHRSTIAGNFFFGNGRPRTAGIRVHGSDHRVLNNYLSGLGQFSIALPAGQARFVPTGHEPTLNCLVAHNTIVEPAGPAIVLGAERTEKLRNTPPTHATFLNNLITGSAKGVLLVQELFAGPLTWTGNLAFPTGEARLGVAPHPGLTLRNPDLEKAADGLWRPRLPAPLLGESTPFASLIKEDMDGQPRPARPSIGADEVSDALQIRRPLRPQDVGPDWMKI